MPPGRAIRASDDAEVQFAFAGAAPDTAGQKRAVADVGSSTPTPDPTNRPFSIRPLPARLNRADLDPVPAPLTLLGVGGDAAESVAIDLASDSVLLTLAGPPRSGRSTVLRLVLEQAASTAAEVWVAAPRRSPLFDEASSCGARVIAPEDPAPQVADSVAAPCLLLVDDSEVFLDTPAGDVLADLLKAGTGNITAVVAGRNDELAVTYRGIASEVRRSRCGLLLQPAPGDGELLGVRLPRNRAVPIPGRGVLVLDQPALRSLAPGSDVLPVQVALPQSMCGYR
jgi:S-DNA-T family DNA segregation ATPase FtsK/SpoIIIE